MTETITLTSSMVVSGKKKLKPGRLAMMSPGRRNKGLPERRNSCREAQDKGE